jgi:hypothetical protein
VRKFGLLLGRGCWRAFRKVARRGKGVKATVVKGRVRRWRFRNQDRHATCYLTYLYKKEME